MKKIGAASEEFLNEVLSVIDACSYTKPEPGSRD